MSRRKKIGIVAAILITLLAAGAVLLSLVNGPAKGTIKTSEESTTQRANLDLASKQLRGEYFTLVHSATYGSSTDTSSDNPRALEQHTLLKELYPGYERIVITIFALEPGGLTQESSYQLRLQKPEQYTRTEETLGGHEMVVFTASDKSEVTMFFANQSFVATVAVTSTTSSDDLGVVAREVARSFEWLVGVRIGLNVVRSLVTAVYLRY